MKVLVTGSNGFIGSHVCTYMKQQGHTVIGLGRQSEAQCEVDEYLSCDMGSDELFEVCGNGRLRGTEAIIHLAADMRKDPFTVHVVTTNCGGTERLLQICRKNEIPVFVQLSSLPVIGKPIEHPVTESHPLDPYTAYHVTKVAEEMLAEFATKAYGIRTASFRISAPIGIRMNPQTIFPTFVKQAVRGETISLSGKGTRQQTYIHAKDIARALDMAIHSKAQGVYNLSSKNRLSNLELAQKCVAELKSSSDIVFSGQEDSMDSYVWDVSLEKLMADTGFTAQISIEEAIAEYAGYVRKNEGTL